MAARVNRWVALALALLLTACGSTGPVVEPAPLAEIQPRFKVDSDWHHNISVRKDTQMSTVRPALDRDNLYIADGKGRVYAWHRRTGKKRWRVDSGLALASGIGEDDTQLYMGDYDGAVIALRKDDGAVVWRSQVSSEILTPPVAARDTVLVRTVDGQLFAPQLAAVKTAAWRRDGAGEGRRRKKREARAAVTGAGFMTAAYRHYHCTVLAGLWLSMTRSWPVSPTGRWWHSISMMVTCSGT